MQLPSPARRACINKYRIPLRTLSALGLDPDGLAMAAHDFHASAPALEPAIVPLRQTSLANWRICKGESFTCELSLSGSTTNSAAAKDSGAETGRQSHGTGSIALCSEEDSRCPPARRTHTKLAAFPPPPHALSQTGHGTPEYSRRRPRIQRL